INFYDKKYKKFHPTQKPYKLIERLIKCSSNENYNILDPFMGTGSTHAASIALERNSVGFEIDEAMKSQIDETIKNASKWGIERRTERLKSHQEFIHSRELDGKEIKYFNDNISMKVMTSQETDIDI
ncbi:MAG: site-specific DNA-methyltransferase, partial [Euryarchaeota archaeon]